MVIDSLHCELDLWEFLMSSTTVAADAKFLRRVFMGLVVLTLFTGGMAGLATVQAMSSTPGSCLIFCE
jgi:hypothetical protein